MSFSSSRLPLQRIFMKYSASSSNAESVKLAFHNFGQLNGIETRIDEFERYNVSTRNARRLRFFNRK
jgi:hypothetical protein